MIIDKWIKKDGKYQHLFSTSRGLYVDGKCVCSNPSPFINYLFEKYYHDNKIFCDKKYLKSGRVLSGKNKDNNLDRFNKISFYTNNLVDALKKIRSINGNIDELIIVNSIKSNY